MEVVGAEVTSEPTYDIEGDEEFVFSFRVLVTYANGEVDDVEVKMPIDREEVREEAIEKAEIDARTSREINSQQDLDDMHRDQIRKYL